MTLPDDLLERPAGESARWIVLELLEHGHKAAKRLSDRHGRHDRHDDTALHDFRVAIRRARATLDSWSDHLPKKAKALRKRLTTLQRTTGVARDTEVALEWLRSARIDASPEHGLAIDWLSTELAAQQGAASNPAQLAEDFEAVRADLAPRMRRMEYDLLSDRPDPTFAELLSVRVRERFRELADLLGGVLGPDDTDRMHRARIAGKKLRYLVEPIEWQAKRAASEASGDGSEGFARPARMAGPPGDRTSHGGGAGPVDRIEPLSIEVVNRMKELQDLLGDLHDVHVLADRIAELRLTVDEFDLRTSIDSLHSRVVSNAVRLYHQLEAWRLDEIRASVDALAASLADHRSIEIERKYLLSGMPDLPGGSKSIEIDQGYIPGHRLHERVRRVKRDESIEYYRTVKLGLGVERTEIEEPCTEEIFDALWSLTKGRRVHKRRHLVKEGELTWEIDQFLDRPLVVAEIELPSADFEPSIPAWLAPKMIEDVSERREYSNLSLAR